MFFKFKTNFNLMKYFPFVFSVLFLLACSEQIKSNKKVHDEVMSSASTNETGETKSHKLVGNENVIVKTEADLIGNWVGWFEPDMGGDNMMLIDDALTWGRENKITISIEDISENLVKGHTVVAGNFRPFSGSIESKEDRFILKLDEPGDDKYDGSFQIEMIKDQKILKGKWKAFKPIEINKRKYKLTKKIFKYNPNQELENSRRYVDWTNLKTTKFKYEHEGEIYEDISSSFSSATESIYSINASSRLLTKSDVENLMKGDLIIIRNTIYARHGFSFKSRPLRIFFDAQEWYMPVNTDIKSNLTEIEKKNIQLLLKYEKNAVEYYDYFGRG